MVNAIPDIPRLYTAVAEWLSCGMLVLLLGPKIRKTSLAIFSMVYLAILVLFMELTANVWIWLWVPCMLAAFFSMLLFIKICTQCSFYESVYYAVIAFSIAECIASLQWQIANAIIADTAKYAVIFEIVILVAVYGIVLFILWKLFRLRLPADKRLNIENRDWVSALFIGIVVFAFSNINFMRFESPMAQYSNEIANVRTLVDIAGVAILYAHFLACYNNMVEKELEAVQNVLKNQYIQYKQSRESIDLVNMKYHDLKHQIQMLREMNDREERDAFLDGMEADIKAYELQNKTGNAVLDTLLTGKSMYCAKHQITMTVIADGRLLDFMDAVDVCSIFGNALDNAIESVMKTEDKEKRLIHLTVSKVKSFVMIRVENYFEGELKMDDGELVSTKADKDFHGYGIKSIKYTADRYGGVATVNANDQWFELKILIPYNE